MPPFPRLISIDYSGAGTDAQPCAIRVAEWSASTPERRIVPPPPPRTQNWTRAQLRDWLWTALQSDQRTLIACDFAFGYPWNSDAALFGVNGWPALIARLAAFYDQHETARAAATAINQLHPPGPFRFNACRNDPTYYARHGVGYYRLAEAATPQSISPWYLGSGATVGFHTITGLSMLHALLARRDAGESAHPFAVWPHENLTPDPSAHLFVECYPALCPPLPEGVTVPDPHTRDALKVLHWLTALPAEAWPQLFTPSPLPFGRYEGVDFIDQIRFEGWIIGPR